MSVSLWLLSSLRKSSFFSHSFDCGASLGFNCIPLVSRGRKVRGGDANDAADIGAGHHALHLPDALDRVYRIPDGREDRCEVRLIELLKHGTMACHLLQYLWCQNFEFIGEKAVDDGFIN
jgi:hypothetical protein